MAVDAWNPDIAGTSKPDSILKPILKILMNAHTICNQQMKSVSAVQPARTYTQIMNLW